MLNLLHELLQRMFYLLVDKEEAPLIIDQPEGNLDKQTIYHLLRPAIQEAQQQRQVILVTHSEGQTKTSLA